MTIEIAQWAPDLAETNTKVATVATNVYPAPNSYRPARAATAYSAAVSSDVNMVCIGQQTSGNFLVFAGTDSTIELLDSSDLTWDVKGSGYSATADDRWSTVQFGTYQLFTNINDGLLQYDLEGGGTVDAVTGSPPMARYVDVIEGYVVLAALASDPFGIAWSGTEDHTSWTPGTDNSDVQSFPDGGEVMNFSGAAGLVIQQRAIRQMIHSPGSGITFQFQKIEDAKGTIAPYSVVKRGSAVGYLADDGFWFAGEPIGANKINRYFLSNANQSRLFSVIGAVDPTGPRLMWAYRTGDTDTYDRLLVYDWSVKRWSEVQIEVATMASLATPGMTLEGIGALYATLEDVPYSLDSRVWLGGRPTLGVVGSDNKLAFLEGDTLEATVETGEIEFTPGRRTMLRWVRPLVDSAAAAVRVRKRDRLADSGTWGSEAAMSAAGRCAVRSDGRYQRIRVRIPAGEEWTHFQGLDVDGNPTGAR